MNDFFAKLKKILLYGGIEKEEYKMISKEIDDSNRKIVILLSCISLFVYSLRLCLSYSTVPDINRIIFLNAILLFGILAIGNILLPDHDRFVHISAYLFLIFFLAVGILSSIGSGSIHERTTLYLVFVFAAPMLYSLNAIELTAIIAPAQIIYLILITKFQSAYSVYATNFGNSLFFSISGLLLGIYMANMKISGIYNTYMNTKNADLQQLNKQLDFNRQRLQSTLSVNNENLIHISDLLENIKMITQIEILHKHLDFQIETKNLKHDKILSDSLKLQQLLLNILENAIRFTPFGGSVHFLVLEDTTAPSKYADYEFRIKDNGIGMSKEFQEHIFEPFSQEHSPSSHPINGAGLGMSITKNIVDSMGGTISVNSKEGEGSEFVVHLRFVVDDID